MYLFAAAVLLLAVEEGPAAVALQFRNSPMNFRINMYIFYKKSVTHAARVLLLLWGGGAQHVILNNLIGKTVPCAWGMGN